MSNLSCLPNGNKLVLKASCISSANAGTRDARHGIMVFDRGRPVFVRFNSQNNKNANKFLVIASFVYRYSRTSE